MPKPLDAAAELAQIQRELAKAMDHARAIPMEINHAALTLAFYKVECCRVLLHRLQLALGNESAETKAKPCYNALSGRRSSKRQPLLTKPARPTIQGCKP